MGSKRQTLRALPPCRPNSTTNFLTQWNCKKKEVTKRLIELTPRMPQDLTDGLASCKALTYSGSAAATLCGSLLPNHSPSFFCFSSVSGGNLSQCCQGPCPVRKIENLPLNWDRIVFEPIGDERLVLLLLIARGQNISTLESLVEESEDVEYRDEALGSLDRTSHICINGWFSWVLGWEKDGAHKFSCLRAARTCLWGRVQRIRLVVCCNRPRYVRW